MTRPMRGPVMVSRAYVAVWLAWALTAVPAAAETLVPVEAVHGSASCPFAGDEASVRVIDSSAQWTSSTSAEVRTLFGRDLLWDRERVIVFALGRQRTQGYRIDPAERLLVERDGVLTLPVRIRRPEGMAATALSRPCLVVSVPRDTWRSVQVTEAPRGRVVASATVR